MTPFRNLMFWAVCVSCVLLSRGLPWGIGSPAWGQDAPATIYSAEQAVRGLALYNQRCALCHAQDMSGGPGAPPLSGGSLQSGWDGKSAVALFDYIRTNMPPGEGGRLSATQYADVMATVLQSNGFPVGAKALPADRQMLGTTPLQWPND